VISIKNNPINNNTNDEDFTLNEYEKLLEIAKKSYLFVGYKNIDWNKRFILWRHDVDYSLNRALELAKIEAKNKVTSTYFLNINSEFYNLMEANQMLIIKKIINYGHEIGIHLDTSSNELNQKNSLEDILNYQKNLFIQLFNLCPTSFSFHNPKGTDYYHENFSYGGLVNCYSKKFKDNLPYCSDSNGYWRFRRLKDVLNKASDFSLQVLTHPGWWQEKEMSPRKKVLRCIYGRALSNIEKYDKEKENDQRLNFCLFNSKIIFLRDTNPKLYKLFDFLYNNDYHKLLVLELWQLHQKLIKNLYINNLKKDQNLEDKEAITYYEKSKLKFENEELLINYFGQKKSERIIGIKYESYRNINKMIKKINNLFEDDRLELINYLINKLCLINKNIYKVQKNENIYPITDNVNLDNQY